MTWQSCHVTLQQDGADAALRREVALAAHADALAAAAPWADNTIRSTATWGPARSSEPNG